MPGGNHLPLKHIRVWKQSLQPSEAVCTLALLRLWLQRGSQQTSLRATSSALFVSCRPETSINPTSMNSSLQSTFSALRLPGNMQSHCCQRFAATMSAASGLVHGLGPRQPIFSYQRSQRLVPASPGSLDRRLVASFTNQQALRKPLNRCSAAATRADLVSHDPAVPLEAPEGSDIDTSYLDPLSEEQLSAVTAPADAQIRQASLLMLSDDVCLSP